MAGIALAINLPVDFGFWFYAVAAVLIALMLYVHTKGQALSAWFGLLTTLLFFLLGVHLVNVNTLSNKPNYFAANFTPQSKLIVEVAEPTQIKAKSVKVILAVKAVNNGSGWQPAPGKILSYFTLDNTAMALAYGDRLILNNNLQLIAPPQNPGQFNYKVYLAHKGIYHQAFVKEADYTIVESQTGNPLLSWVYGLRSHMLWLFKESGLQGAEFAIASALVLGYDDDIEPALLDAYSASGTLHILSVSGMHVGLVYWLLLFFFKPLGNGLQARIARGATTIVVLWLYAMLTGFSPPVIRAAAMCSFLAVGQSIYRHTNIYNILATSCLIMLLANPFLLADVGFQLSYAAVLGIVIMYPGLSSMYNIAEKVKIPYANKPPFIKQLYWCANFITTGTWGIIVMSLSAQLATLPLGLYYFHQFPNYFILSNLLIIPLSTVCIVLGMIVLLATPVMPLAKTLGLALGWLIKQLNYLAHFAEDLPQALSTNFKLNIVEVVLGYAVIITAIVFFKSGKKPWLYAALTMAIGIMGLRINQTNNQLRQQKLVVYAINKASAVEVISGNKSVLFADSLTRPPSVNYNFNLKSPLWYYGIDNRIMSTLNGRVGKEQVSGPHPFVYYNPPIVVAGTQTVLLYNSSFKPKQLKPGVQFNYIIISGNPYVNFTQVESYRPKLVIFDSSNKPAKVKYWQKELDMLHIPTHNTAKQGYLEIPFGN